MIVKKMKHKLKTKKHKTKMWSNKKKLKQSRNSRQMGIFYSRELSEGIKIKKERGALQEWNLKNSRQSSWLSTIN